jgi:hypothetical protein
MAKKKLVSTDHLTFTQISAEKNKDKPTERNLAEELYRKSWQNEKVDAFEKQMGIAPGSKKPKLQYQSKVLSPEVPTERELLNKLMNSPKYAIIYWKDNWTPQGEYRAFIIYSENLDYKAPPTTQEIAEGAET